MEYVPAQVRGQLEALLLRPMLEPLAHGFGEYGDIAASAFAEALAKALCA